MLFSQPAKGLRAQDQLLPVFALCSRRFGAGSELTWEDEGWGVLEGMAGGSSSTQSFPLGLPGCEAAGGR